MRRWLTLALIAFIVFIVNFPLAHATFLSWQLDQRGVEVAATVTQTREVGDDLLVQFTVPGDGRRDEFEGAVADVDRATYDAAEQTGELTVTVLPDDGGVFRAEGQVPSRIGLVVTLLADVFILAMVVLMFRFRNSMRVELVLRASEDLERCPPGSRLDRISGQRYLVSGDVVEIDDDEILLDLGDRRIRVLLDGHANPAGHQQPVRVIGFMVA